MFDHIRHHHGAVDEIHDEARIGIIETVFEMRIRIKVDLLLGVIQHHVEAPQQVIANQAAQVRVVGDVGNIVKHIGGHVVKAVPADAEFPDRGHGHFYLPRHALHFGLDDPPALPPPLEKAAVIGKLL